MSVNQHIVEDIPAESFVAHEEEHSLHIEDVGSNAVKSPRGTPKEFTSELRIPDEILPQVQPGNEFSPAASSNEFPLADLPPLPDSKLEELSVESQSEMDDVHLSTVNQISSN
jgi:hypothetical protein